MSECLREAHDDWLNERGMAASDQPQECRRCRRLLDECECW